MSVLDEVEVKVGGLSVRKIGAALKPGKGGRGKPMRSAVRVARFDPDAEDADGDQLVQEGTNQERAARAAAKAPGAAAPEAPAPAKVMAPRTPEELLAQRRQRAAEKAKVIEEVAKTRLTEHQLQTARRHDFSDLLDVDNDPMIRWDQENPPPYRTSWGGDGDEEYQQAFEEWEAAREEFEQNAPDREEQLYEVINDIFSGKFVAADGKEYHAAVQYVEETFSGAQMEGQIQDLETRQIVARFTRTLQTNGVVGHDHLKVEKDFQGRGIASAFNARNEELYRAMGFDSIEVHGVSNMNGYKGATHWPKNGFDWASDIERERFLGAMQAVVDRYQDEIRLGGELPVTKARVVDVADGGFQKVEDLVFDTAEQGRLLSQLIAQAMDEDFETGQIRAADLLFWPGAEDYFASRNLDFVYTRPL